VSNALCPSLRERIETVDGERYPNKEEGNEVRPGERLVIEDHGEQKIE
jgi:hypothetical protein